MTAYLKRLQFESIESFTENPTAYIQRVEVVEVVDIYGNPIPIGPPTPPGPIPSLDLPFAETESLIDVISNTNLITFTRSSNGTYVGSDKLIKYSPANLLTYSQDYENNVWTINNILLVPNRTIAPDGTQTGSQITAITNASGVEQNETFVDGAIYTLSCYVKRRTGTGTFVNRTAGGGSSRISATYNLENATATVANNATAATIVPVGNGWYRCTVTGPVSSNENRIILLNGMTAQDQFYLWGAQLELNGTVSEYIPTTSATTGNPRFDHDPTTGESLGLLIENPSTNNATWSNEFGSGKYLDKVNTNPITITNNAAVSPDGTQNAATITQVDDNYLRVSAGSLPAGDRCISAYFKPLGTTDLFRIAKGGGDICELDLSTMTINQTGSFVVSSGFQVLSNGWYRFWAVFNRNAGWSINIQARNPDNSQGEYALWGFQFEDGSYPSSVIPTAGAAATRAPDIVQIEGANFQTENLLEYSNYFTANPWSNELGNQTVIPNVVDSPFGTTTASKLIVIDSTIARERKLWQLADVAVGEPYTFSVYIKAVTGQVNTGSLDITLGNNDNIDATQTFTATNQWQRISVTTNSAGAAQIRCYITGDANAQLYIWGAQFESGSTATTYIPSVETFVSRASIGTYVSDTTGLVTESAVNYLLDSQDITSASWGFGNVIRTADAAIAPDGTLTADNVLADTSITTRHIVSQFYQSSDPVVFSVYVKNNGVDFIAIKSSQGNVATEFDLINGVVTRSAPNGGLINPQIESVGNGWYRISGGNSASKNWLIMTSDGTTPFNTSADIFYLAGPGEACYVWGAQLELGSTVNPYIVTTNTIGGAARYQDGELLLENAATNLVENSSDLSASTWLSSSLVAGSFTSSTDSPVDGELSYRVLPITKVGAGGSHLTVDPGARWAFGGNRAYSYFVKNNGGSKVCLDYAGNPQADAVYFDFSSESFKKYSNNTVVTDGVGFSKLANGWYRIYITNFTANDLGYMTIGSNYWYSNVEGDVDVLVCAPQAESGNYPTSFIPTTSSSATRSADVSTSTAGVSSWYNQNEGTVFVEAAPYTDAIQRTFTNFRDTADFNKRQLLGTNQLFFNLGDVNIPITPMAGNQKLAYGVDVDNVALYRDGVVVGGDSSFTLNPANEFQIGRLDSDATRYLNGHMKRVAYYDTKLPNSTLQELTS